MSAVKSSSPGNEQALPNAPGPRGFVYALEPVRSQRVWKLEKIRLELAHHQNLLTEQQKELFQLNALLAAGSSVALGAFESRLDPGAHVRSLAYLARLQKEIAQQRIKVDALQAKQSDLKEEYFRAHRLLDAMNQHRDLAIHAYESESLRQQAVEADRDWLAHLAVSHDGGDQLNKVSTGIPK